MSYGTDHWGIGEDHKRKMLLWMVFMKLKLDGQMRWYWDPATGREFLVR